MVPYRPPAEQVSHVTSSLHNVIEIADSSLDYAEIDDETLIVLFATIHTQVVALYVHDAILQVTSHRDRCIYLCGVLPHFCDTQDTFFLTQAEVLLDIIVGSGHGVDQTCQHDMLGSGN